MRKPKNIIIIIVDSLRFDSTFQDGNAGLDYIENNSVNFQQARSGGCWTLPSTASIFTGLMPHQHRTTSQTRRLPEEIPTLADKLRTAGYQPLQVTGNIVTTDIFGLDRSFDHTYKIWNHVKPRLNRLPRMLMMLSRPRVRKEIMAGEFGKEKVESYLNAGNVWAQHTHQDIFDMTKSIIKENEAKNQKSFLFLNLMESHFPYHVNSTFQVSAPSLPSQLSELLGLYHMVNMSFLKKEQPFIKKRTQRILKNRQRRSWRLIRKNLDAFVQEMHQDKDNLIVFAADHGDNFGEQDWFYHFSNVTDAGNHVPLFWLDHNHNHNSPQIETRPVSLTSLHDSILQACGMDYKGTTLFDDEANSLPVMQSYWYNNHGKTLEKFKYNQMAFVDSNQRYLYKKSNWYAAPVDEVDQEESPFEPLPAGSNPIEDLIEDSERKAFLRKTVREFDEFSQQVM